MFVAISIPAASVAASDPYQDILRARIEQAEDPEGSTFPLVQAVFAMHLPDSDTSATLYASLLTQKTKEEALAWAAGFDAPPKEPTDDWWNYAVASYIRYMHSGTIRTGGPPWTLGLGSLTDPIRIDDMDVFELRLRGAIPRALDQCLISAQSYRLPPTDLLVDEAERAFLTRGLDGAWTPADRAAALSKMKELMDKTEKRTRGEWLRIEVTTYALFVLPPWDQTLFEDVFLKGSQMHKVIMLSKLSNAPVDSRVSEEILKYVESLRTEPAAPEFIVGFLAGGYLPDQAEGAATQAFLGRLATEPGPFRKDLPRLLSLWRPQDPTKAEELRRWAKDLEAALSPLN
ncbi:hypothetical protein GC173_00420 [bacterium]|nr:hypothetical protein [bacterium]